MGGLKVLDIVLGTGLFLAVMGTILVDKAPQPIVEEPDDPPEVPDHVTAAKLRLAVTTPHFDDMGRLLRQLGPGYDDYKTINPNDLLSYEKIKDYDVVFFTCNYLPNDWADATGGTGARNGISATVKPHVESELVRALRTFVEEGGTLYASDWQFGCVATVFSEFVSPSLIDTGQKQELVAKVVDKGLAEAIGDHIALNFDLPGWRTAAFAKREVTTMLEGEFENLEGKRVTAPLLIKFPFGKGNVIFTSFHNEKANAEKEIEMLQFLVFATVTARADSAARETRMKGGFSPQKQSLLSASKSAPSVTKTYKCTKSGLLQFVLAFENQGAELELKVVDPSGKTVGQQSGKQTFDIEVKDAQVGNWTYTVTAKKVPFENFPYTMTVWQK